MARALAYQLEFISEVYKHNHLVEIWEEGYIGSVTKLRMGASGLISKRDRDGGVYGTSMELKLESTLDSQLIKLYTADATKFLVMHYRNNVLVQSGFIVPEQYSEEYIAPPYDIAVLVTDGLGILKEKKYTYYGRHTVLEVLKYCLDSTGLNLDFDIVCDLREAGVDPARSVLAQITVDGEKWRDRTIYEALSELSATFRAYITQYNGRWRFARFADLLADSMIYTNSLSYLISIPNQVRKLGSLSNDLYPIGNLTFQIDPAYKSAKFTRTYDKRVSFFENPDFKMLDGWDVATTASTQMFRDKNYVVLRSLPSGEEISQTINVEASIRTFNFEISYFKLSLRPLSFSVALRLISTSGQVLWLGKEGWQGAEERFDMVADAENDLETIYNTTSPYNIQTIQQSGTIKFETIPADGELTLYIRAQGPSSVGTDEAARSKFCITDALLTTEVEKGLTVDAILNSGNIAAGDTEIFFGDSDVGDNASLILSNYFKRTNGQPTAVWKVGSAGAEDSFFNTMVRDYVVYYGLPKRILSGYVMGEHLQVAQCLLDKYADTYMYIDTMTIDVYADQAEVSAYELLPHLEIIAVNEDVAPEEFPRVIVSYTTLPDGSRVKTYTVASSGSAYKRVTSRDKAELTLEEILKIKSRANYSNALAALAQKKADTANLIALEASQSADDALLRLNNIVNNSIVSVEEKAGLLQLIDRLSGEMLLYASDSNNKGADITALQDTFIALLDFLSTVVHIASNEATELTPAQVEQYSALFADFYAKRSVFTTDVSTIRAELLSYATRISDIDKDKSRVTAEYNSTSEAQGLTITLLQALTTAKNEYFAAHTAHKDLLLSIIADDKITAEERASAGVAFATYSTKLSNFNIAVESAKKSITDAIGTTLESWVADGVISPLEKLAIKQTRAQVASEKEALVANAAIFDVDSSVYLGAWSAYDAVLNKYSADTPENITVESDFATAEADYRVAKIALLSAITNVQVDETQGKHPLGGHPDLDFSAKNITSNSIASDNFASNGFLGSGYKLSKDAEGKTKLEVDELLVRQSATFYELIIQQAKHQGGIVFYTAASMECISVTEQPDSYRCFFDTKDGQIPNEWAVNDQARCQRFAGKYYWRLVTAVGTDYIDLSKADTNGAGVPEKGDIIVQLGNRADTARQAAKVTTVIGADAPRDEFYEGINSFYLTGKLITIVGMKDGKAGIYTTNGEFSGKVSIGAGSSGLSGLAEWAAAAQDIEAAQSTANQAVQSAASLQSYVDNTLPAELSSLQAQIDGKVESWYYDYSPTLANYPANEWITDVLKDRHIGDTFTNTQEFIDSSTTPDAGKSWRFVKNGSVYSWTPIADSDAVKALLAASKAQDTADGKRQVFVTQPKTPYKVGDLWTQGPGGELMRCVNQRLSGAYVAGDWDKAVKYTDDTAVNEIQIGGRNLLIGTNKYTGWITSGAASYSGVEIILGMNGASNYALKSWDVNTIFVIGKTYTISLKIRHNSTGVLQALIESGGNFAWRPDVTSEYTTVSRTFVATNNTGYTLFASNSLNVAGKSFYIKDIKIELGNKATDWTEAYEDIDAKIQDQQIYVEYSINGSTDWHTTFATGDIFMRQKKGSGAWSAAIRIVGEKGEAGNEGRYTDYQFAKNTSTTTAPSSGWQDAPPAITAGEYVWMRVGEVIPPATSPASWSTAVRITGDKGDTGPQGVPGTPGADGVTYYTWIRYADTSAGAGISNDPTGKLYIGFAYNKTTPSESNTPSDYTWSLIKGEQGNQGVQGPPGANGVTTYTWIKYSDNADGTGLYDTPTANTRYIGIAVNKTTASESSVKTDYVWSLFKGADGKSVTATDVEFAQSASATTAPSSGWQTTAPAWEDGKYIWTRTKTTYSEGSPSYSAAVNLTGAKGTTGNTGSTGTGVDSITEEYYLSTSKTEQTGGSWSTTPPTWSTGKYVWTRVKIVYKNPASTVYTTAVVSSEWEAVNEIQIGGRNLLIGTNKYTGWITSGAASYSGVEIILGMNGASNYALKSWDVNTIFVIGKTYTISLKIRHNSTGVLQALIESGGNFAWRPDVTSEYTTVSRTFVATNNTGYTLFASNSLNVAGKSFYIKDIKVELGNKPTDWTEAYEDTQAAIDEAKAKALELEYLKTALAGTTEIQNGLVLTRMMLLKNALEQVTAGISGLTTNDLFLFANDSDALNAALNDIATFSLKRNGTGNLGNLRITRDGLAYCPRLANGKLGAPIIEFRSTPIPPLSDLVASFTTSVNGVGGSDNKTGGVKTGNFGYSSAITVSAYDNFSMRVQGLLEASINNAGDKPIIDSHAAVNIVLYKYAGGVYTQERVVASLYIMHDVMGSLSDSISVDETFMLAKGTYYLRAEYYLNTTLSSLDSAQISASSLVMTASGASGQKMMIFGSNGFVRIKDGTNYTYMSDEMMAHRGVLDIQGVRGSGSVASNGVMANAFGKATGASRSSNGIYVVNHSVGHTNYGVNLTIISSNAQLNAVVTAKNNTSFEVKIVNASNNALSDSAFDFSMYANV